MEGGTSDRVHDLRVARAKLLGKTDAIFIQERTREDFRLDRSSGHGVMQLNRRARKQLPGPANALPPWMGKVSDSSGLERVEPIRVEYFQNLQR